MINFICKSTILDFQKKYSKKIDPLDLDLLISATINKPREFVLAHLEFKLSKKQELKTKNFLARRAKREPLAHILGHREFFGLDFAVNKNTLIPRPETEMLVEEVLKSKPKNKTIIDIGTGSGNIIISLAKNASEKNTFIAVDISKKALQISRKNAKTQKVDKKIKFLNGNLLLPLKKILFTDTCSLIIVANLPYLSQKIYSEASLDVKKYEPRLALLSGKDGLNHYEKLITQIKLLQTKSQKIKILLEISPEQKIPMAKLVKKYFPESKPLFHKDLAGKWRVCEIKL